jgi:hypothetical protein
MQRLVINEGDVKKHVDELAAPYEEAAKTMGISKDKLDIRAAVSTSVPQPDNYQSKLLKFIPAEVVAVYLTLESIIRTADAQIPLDEWLWILFLVLLIGTPLYLWRVTGVTKMVQLTISTIAFAVWVFALGGVFALQDWYRPVYGAMLLPIYTFFAPVITGKSPK